MTTKQGEEEREREGGVVIWLWRGKFRSWTWHLFDMIWYDMMWYDDNELHLVCLIFSFFLSLSPSILSSLCSLAQEWSRRQLSSSENNFLSINSKDFLQISLFFLSNSNWLTHYSRQFLDNFGLVKEKKERKNLFENFWNKKKFRISIFLIIFKIIG